MRACIGVATEDGSGGASCELAHSGHRRRRHCAWAEEGGVGAPGRQTPEGRRHGHPPHSYGGSWPPSDRHEPTHSANRRLLAATKLVEDEPPQLSIEASPPGDDYVGQELWPRPRGAPVASTACGKKPVTAAVKTGVTITPTAYNSTTMKST
jgi:hypothetical protein